MWKFKLKHLFKMNNEVASIYMYISIYRNLTIPKLKLNWAIFPHMNVVFIRDIRSYFSKKAFRKEAISIYRTFQNRT